MHNRLPISFHYYDKQTLENALVDQYALKIISYARQPSPLSSTQHHFTVNLDALGPSRYTEVWLSPEPVQHDQRHNISISMNHQLLCAHMLIEETHPDRLEQTTQAAYEKIYRLLQETDYPYLIRTWNYFPHINQYIDSLERYQAFCVGRANATEAANQAKNQLPAASAIGTHRGPLLIYFIAAKQPGLQLENPIQTSAFEYPDIYSPKSPSFSRAMIKCWGDTSQLYISGTASVLGHKTMHADDVGQQFTQTIENLYALTDKRNLQDQLPEHFNFSDVLWKLYIRNPEHYSILKGLIDTTIKPSNPVLYLHGDICRSDLLMEIEGLYSNEQ